MPADFAAAFPGIAEAWAASSTSAATDDRRPPEGAAFLAARVQLKLKHGIPDFVVNLLDQSSRTTSRRRPRPCSPRGEPTLRRSGPAGGPPDPPGLLSRLGLSRAAPGGGLPLPHHRRPDPVAVRDHPGGYFATPAPLAGMGIRWRRHRRGPVPDADRAQRREAADEPAIETPETGFRGCPVHRLPIHLVGPEARRRHPRAGDRQPHRPLPALRPPRRRSDGPAPRRRRDRALGFDQNEALIPEDPRLFEGFNLLRDYFLFPRKFLGFALTGLQSPLQACEGRVLDIVVTLGRSERAPRRGGQAGGLRPLRRPGDQPLPDVARPGAGHRRQHEYHLVPTAAGRSTSRSSRSSTSTPITPAGGPGRGAAALRLRGRAARPGALAYTIRRLPRRATSGERRHGAASDYAGTDVFLSLIEPTEIDGGTESGVMELSVRALCTNRHLPELLPVGERAVEFTFLDDVQLPVTCLAGPTPPREADRHRHAQPDGIRPMPARSPGAW